MIDRLFTATLTFSLLAAGTLAMVSALFEPSAPAQHVSAATARTVRLPTVEITGKRVDAGTAIARTERNEPATRNVQ
jgi:hypothetical protein